MKNKVVILYLGSFLLFILVLYSLFVATTDFKQIVTSEIQSKFPESKIDEITVKKFPIPQIIISNFSIKDKFISDKAEISLSLLSILKFSPIINNITFTNSNYILTEQNPIINHYDIISKLFELNNNSTKIIFNELTLSDISAKKISYIEMMYLNTNNIQIFYDKTGNNTITVSIQDDKINITNKTPLYNLNLQESYNDGLLNSSSGNIELKNPLLENNKTISNITFDIMSSENIRSINFQSDLISGSGSINYTNPIQSLISLNIDKIDLRLLPHNTDLDYLKKLFNFLLNLEVKIACNININKIFLAQETFSKNVYNVLLNKDQSSIEFSGEIDSGGKYNISGNLSNDLLDGKISINHEDINLALQNLGYKNSFVQNSKVDFQSTINLNSSGIKLEDIICNIGTGNINGSFSIEKNNKSQKITSKLNISEFHTNISDIPFISDIYKNISSLALNLSDKDYLSKYIPIRKIDYLADINLSLNNVQLDDTRFDQLNLDLSIAPQKINVNQLYIKSDNQEVNLSCRLDASSLIPTYSLSINDSTITLTDSIVNHLKSLSSLDIQSFVNNIIINADIKLDKLKIGLSELDSLDINFISNNSNILINKANGNMGQGSFIIEGDVIGRSLTFNIIYGLNSIEIKDLLKLFTDEFPNISGLVSSSGKLIITTNPNLTFFQNIYVDGKFVSQNITVINYSPDEFISKILSPNYNLSNIENDKPLLFINSDSLSNVNCSYNLKGGLISLQDTTFNTQYSAGAVVASIDLQNKNINLDNILSFYSNINGLNQLTKITIDLKGQLNNPEKTVKLEEVKK